MTEFVKCKALVACTEFVAGYGMVHMNPDDPDHAVVDVPAQAVARLVNDERIVVLGDPLDHDDNGKAGGSKAQTGDEIVALRAEYETKVGKKPFNGWNADQLREKIAAAPAKDNGKAGGEPETEDQNAAEEGGAAADNTSDSGAPAEDAAP